MPDQDDAALMRRPLLLFIAVAAGYAAGSQLSFSWFGADGTSASFFPAAGVTLAALVLVERRLWPVVLGAAAVTEVLLDLAHGIGLAPSLGYAVANTVQPLVGALLLTSVRPRVDLGAVTYIDSQGLRLLLERSRRLSATGTAFTVVAPPGGFARARPRRPPRPARR